ncbi:MAG: NAD-dependent succinate-semialdehyde dehydrogenase [Saprospiraceae bacterium]|nr:NAD-dependent succinate-semialdehyde dehydrogenase [Saprospiraceae bacterium]
MTIKAINPANGQQVQSYEALEKEQITAAIEQAHATYKSWRKTTFKERAELMKKAAAVLRKHKQRYAELATKEMGKPLQQSISEVEKCAWVCEYYAEKAADFLSDELVETDASKSYIAYRPIGVVLAVMPWNFPYWQVFRFAAPALMAGNVGLLKHASNVPGCAEAIEEIFREAGFPKGAFTNLLIDTSNVEMVIEHPHVKAATLTGSERAGSAVASQAGKNIKKTVLELGGSDAYLILDDADIEQAAEVCAKSRLLNSGQSCIGAKRFIVMDSVYDAFLKAFKSRMAHAKMGDPMEEGTDVGPLARKDLRDDLHQQVTESIEKGADCILGGKIPELDGAYYPPTILTNIKPGMPAYGEELFGPVASVFKVSSEEEAIRIANDSEFGLGSAVFTNDLERGERIASEELEAGSSFVNSLVKSDPRLPFGGINISGYGRELSYYGIREFTNIKTIWIK